MSRATAAHGPFPVRSVGDETALAWAERRRRGELLGSIAVDTGVSTKQVAAATRAYVPSPGPTRRPHDPRQWAEERRQRISP